MYLLIAVVIVSAILVRGGRKTLWPLFHLLGVLLALPGFLFAYGCLVMQHATGGDLLEFVDRILTAIFALVPWGAAVMLVCVVIVLAAGFGRRWRRPAAAFVAAVSLCSAAVVYWGTDLPKDADQWWFFVPGALSVLIAAVLFVTAGAPSRAFEFQYPGGPCIGQETSVGMLRSLEGQPGFRRRQVGAAGWVWYTLPPFQDDAMKIGVELGFQAGVLRQIGLFHDDPAIYGTSRETGPANKEHLRAENIRAWLRTKGFPVGSYPWGEVWVSHDPRSDFGSAGIRYAHSPQSRSTPSATDGLSDRSSVQSPGAV